METFLIPVFILACPLLVILFIALILYLIPVRFVISFLRQEGQQEYSISVIWGLIGFRSIDTGDGRKSEVLIGGHVMYTRAEEEVLLKGEDVKSPSAADLRTLEGYLTLIPRLIEPVGRFGSLLYHESAYEGIKGRIRIGTGDPVATGMLYGGFWATRCFLRTSRIFIDMIPDFDRKILEMDIAIRIRVDHPLRILIAGIRLFRNPDIRRGMTLMKPDSFGVSES
jgi:hypothetical protein